MAIIDNDGMFASIAKNIESLPDFESEILSKSLIYFMENPDLQKVLPPLKLVSDDFEKFFKLAWSGQNTHRNQRGVLLSTYA